MICLTPSTFLMKEAKIMSTPCSMPNSRSDFSFSETSVDDFEVTPGSSHGGEWSRLAGYWVNMVASLLSRRNRNQQQSKKNQVMMTDEIEEDEQIQIEEKAAVTERRNDQLHFIMYYMRG